MTTTSLPDGAPDGLTRLRLSLHEQYGILISHKDLRVVLGYRTMSAYYRAVREGRVGVRVFNVPGRRGRFALAEEVAQWIWMAREAPLIRGPQTSQTKED